jgi:hypothetical protein
VARRIVPGARAEHDARPERGTGIVAEEAVVARNVYAARKRG